MKIECDANGRVVPTGDEQMDQWLQQMVDLSPGRLGRELTDEETHRIVEAARHPRHPLHNEFEWDDAKAAKTAREEALRESKPKDLPSA